MPFISANAKEIHCKIVYCGPHSAGKSSSLKFIRSRSIKNKINRYSIKTAGENAPAVDLHFLSAGKILDHQFFFQILNLPGNSLEEDSCLLRGVDGLVFVADSRLKAEESNKKALSALKDQLNDQNQDIFRIPLALQYNKRDLKDIMPSHLMRADLNRYNSRDFESSVVRGTGVMEPFKHICRLTITALKSGELF